MGEPCNPRTTRRNGSVGLIEGLGKRKRPRKTQEGDCGPGADVSLVAKRAKLHGERGTSNGERSQKLSGPAVVVDLTKDTGLSETQKLEYEAVGNGISSLVESSRVPRDGEDSGSGPLVARDEQIGNCKVSAACPSRDRDMGDSPDSLPVRSLALKVDAVDLGAGKASRSIDGDQAMREPNSHRLQPASEESTLSPMQPSLVSPEQQMHIVRLGSPLDMPPAKPPDKRRRGRLKGKKKGAMGDDMAAAADQYDRLVLTEDIGLPPEVYNPRPSRSRGAKAVEGNLERGMGKVEGRVQPNTIDGRPEGIDSSKASIDLKSTESKSGYKKKAVHSMVNLGSTTDDGERKVVASGSSGASAVDPSDEDEKENSVFPDAPSSSTLAKAKSRITAVPNSDSDPNSDPHSESDSDSDRRNRSKTKQDNEQALPLEKPETATPRRNKKKKMQEPSTDSTSRATPKLGESADQPPTTVAPPVSETELRSGPETPITTTISTSPTKTLEVSTKPYSVASPTTQPTRQTQGVTPSRAGYRVGLSKRARIQPLLSVVRK